MVTNTGICTRKARAAMTAKDEIEEFAMVEKFRKKTIGDCIMEK